tara:strand:+ start:75 stop:518 length:444 start_codon:yes stop_codon:yes gene_type:complete
MSLYNNLMKSGFLSKAEKELEEARIVIEKQVNDLEGGEDQELWYFNKEAKEADFQWLMSDIDGYELLREEYEEILSDDVFAIKGYSLDFGFTLLCSTSEDTITSIKQETLNLQSRIPYYYTKCNIYSTDIYVLVYTNLIDFPGFELN